MFERLFKLSETNFLIYFAFQFMRYLALAGPANAKHDSSVISGLISAVQALCELTEEQIKLQKTCKADEKMTNSGRIICILQIKKSVKFFVCSFLFT